MLTHTLDSDAYRAWIAQRRAQLIDRCASAAQGRPYTLIAVSKTVDVPEVVAAIDAGYSCFGENRPQELKRKVQALAALELTPRIDMIGNLQTNKINMVLAHAHTVHSISSVHLAQALAERAQRQGMTAHVLLEINVSGEASKSGFTPAHITSAIEELAGLDGLAIQGTMTMAPKGDSAVARRCFAALRELTEQLRTRSGLALPELSCGMSDDFEAGLAEGATMIRLGRIVFDPSYQLG